MKKTLLIILFTIIGALVSLAPLYLGGLQNIWKIILGTCVPFMVTWFIIWFYNFFATYKYEIKGIFNSGKAKNMIPYALFSAGGGLITILSCIL